MQTTVLLSNVLLDDKPLFISFSNVYFQTETDNDVLGLEQGGDVTEMTPLYIQTPRSAMTSSSDTNTSSVV